MPEDILSLSPPAADERVAYGSDPSQFFEVRVPKTKGPHALVINIHGGFWRAKYDLKHAGHLCAALTSKGVATANLEYRRVGNEGGGWPNTFADIRAAYQYLRQNAKSRAYDEQRFLVMGHSAGGQLALCLAGHEPGITRVISLAGVVDLQRAYQLHLSDDAVVEFLHGTPAEVPEHYREADPMQLSIPKAREVLVHGSSDEIVPAAFSREYVAAKQKRRDKEDAQLLEIAAADHFDLIDPRTKAWPEVEKTVLQLLSR